MVSPSVQQSAISGALLGYGAMMLNAGHALNPEPSNSLLANLQNAGHSYISGIQSSIQSLDAFQGAPEALQSAMMAGGPMAAGFLGAGVTAGLAVLAIKKCDFGAMWKACSEGLKGLFRSEPAFAGHANTLDQNNGAYDKDNSEIYFAYDPQYDCFHKVDESFYDELSSHAEAVGEKVCVVAASLNDQGGFSYKMNLGGEMTSGDIGQTPEGFVVTDHLEQVRSDALDLAKGKPVEHEASMSM